ncbi:hypothetical protein D3C83_66990 [compost metagenome]
MLGYLLQRLRVLPASAAQTLNLVVLYVCLPAAVLQYAPQLELAPALLGVVAVPWLLLGAKSTAGAGVFGRTTSIQRVRTAGGTTPAEACGQAQVGKVARVAYEATYYFYVPRP